MIATATPYQLTFTDLEIDRARWERADWQRALDDDLRAVQDYVHQDTHYIVWKPGEGKRGGNTRTQDVQLASATSCTCQRFKLRERCQHVAFVRRMEAADQLPDMHTPVAARKVQ